MVATPRRCYRTRDLVSPSSMQSEYIGWTEFAKEPYSATFFPVLRTDGAFAALEHPREATPTASPRIPLFLPCHTAEQIDSLVLGGANHFSSSRIYWI